MDRPLTTQEAWEAVRQYGSKRAAARALGIPWGTFWEYLQESEPEDPEVVEQNVHLAKRLQASQDRQRVERKAFREYARVENAVSAYANELAAILREHQFNDPPPPGAGPSPICGIFQLSDLHLNECVDLPHNQFNWEIASKRLKKYVDEARDYFKAKGVGKVMVAMTADLLNSDRRLDELLANANNRAKASVLALDLLAQVIRDLHRDFEVVVAGVSGNESRMTKDVGWHPEVASDNYDWQIYEMLRMLLEGEGIHFVEPRDPSEVVVSVGGANVLLLHGHGKIGNDVSRSVQQIKGQYAARNIHIDMVLYGHVHEARIADHYARSSSLVGANDYSEKALNLIGQASQNIYIVREGGQFDGIKVSLQNTEGIEGYPITKRLEAYNSKAQEKGESGEAILRVVI